MRVIRGVWRSGRSGSLGGLGGISLVALLCLPLAGCARQSAPTPEPIDLNGEATSDRTRVRVDNQNLKDMTIYAYQGGHRIRLGRVTGNTTRDLVVPKSVVGNVIELRFYAEPLGGGRGYLSETIPVSPGDLVEFVVYSR